MAIVSLWYHFSNYRSRGVRSETADFAEASCQSLWYLLLKWMYCLKSLHLWMTISIWQDRFHRLTWDIVPNSMFFCYYAPRDLTCYQCKRCTHVRSSGCSKVWMLWLKSYGMCDLVLGTVLSGIVVHLLQRDRHKLRVVDS